MNKKYWLIIGAGGLALAGYLFSTSSWYLNWRLDEQHRELPPEENVNITLPVENNNINSEVVVTNTAPATAENNNTAVNPTEKNFAVPFTSQAPHANWDLDHNEFCEEASVLMTGRFWKKLPIISADDTEAALQRIKSWELDNLGFYYDTTAAETAEMLAGVYGLKTRVAQNPTLDDIKTEISSGRPVIVPTAGRELNNPFYTPPGPIYHMLVIKGYTADGKFITNDPGTRRGADFVFSVDDIMGAMHDWVPGDDRTVARNGSPTGAPVMIVASW